MAENKPTTPDDKKTGPANDTANKSKAAPVKEPVTADGKAPENSGAKKAAAQDSRIKNFPSPEKGTPGSGLSPADEAKKKEQEALLSALDENAARIAKNNKTAPKKAAPGKGKPPAPAKEEKKPEPPPLSPAEIKERKQKLEKELREKYGVPKSDKPVEPYVIPETEKVVRIPHEQLNPFKGHTFKVTKDAKFDAFVASIKAQGVTQPVIVRPDGKDKSGKDKYEIISGHRRDAGGIEAGIPYSPCIIRALNDEQAIQQMVEDNVLTRKISIMELAKSLAAQLKSISRQGARDTLAKNNLDDQSDENISKRSNEIIAERNGISVTQVKRYVALTKLSPALQEFVEGKLGANGKPIKIGFTTAVELSGIRSELHDNIAVSIDGNQSSPSLAQAQRMRKLDLKNELKPDTIDGILMEPKKEVDDKMIISSAELAQYFGKDTPIIEMKEKIMELLDTWSFAEKDISAPEKKNSEQEL